MTGLANPEMPIDSNNSKDSIPDTERVVKNTLTSEKVDSLTEFCVRSALLTCGNVESFRFARSSKAGSELCGALNQSWLSEFAETLYSRKPLSLNNALGHAWDSNYSQVVQTGPSGVVAHMIPEGTRARQAPYDLYFYPGAWDNAVLGDAGSKVQAALESERSSYDPAYHRFARRERYDAQLAVWSRLNGTASHYIAWTQEALCAMLLPRAIQRNYRNSNTFAKFLGPNDFKLVCETIRSARKGSPLSDRETWIQEHLAELRDPQHAWDDAPATYVGADGIRLFDHWRLPGDGDTSAKIVASDMLSDPLVSSALFETQSQIYVSQALSPAQLFEDIRCLWAGTLSEFGVYSSCSYLVVPGMSSTDIRTAFIQIGLSYSKYGWFRIGRIVHWVKFGSFTPRVSGYQQYTQGDIQRVVTLNTYHRFRYYDHNNVEHSLSEVDSRPCPLRCPYASWLARVANFYGMLECVEGTASPIDWRCAETYSWWQGMMLGNVADAVQQRTCGHWSNLAHIDDVGMYNLVNSLHIALSNCTMTKAGLTPSGVFYPIPVADRSRFQTVDRQYVRRLVPRPSSYVSDNVLVHDVPRRSSPVPGMDEETGGVWGSPDSPPPILAGQAEPDQRCWAVLVRANWYSWVSPQLGSVFNYAMTRWAPNPSGPLYTVPWASLSADESHGLLTRIFALGGVNTLLMKKLWDRGSVEDMPIVRVGGGPAAPSFVWSSPELYQYCTFGINTARALPQYRCVPSFSCPNSNLAVAPGPGSVLSFM
jgi:hypothetical protein